MILHILKKDLRRLWPLVLALVSAHLLFVAIQLELFAVSGTLRNLSRVIGGNAFSAPFLPTVNIITLMGFFLAVMAAQLDPLPGDPQDWLVRPVRRSDLLLAKLLFVVVMIQVPMLAADTAQGLGAGTSIGLTLTEAFWRNIYLFLTVSMPGLLLGSMTRNIGQMLGLFAAVCLTTLVGIELIINVLLKFPNTNTEHGFTFAFWAFRTVLFFGVALAILGLQYFRRATALSRALFLAVIVLLLSSQDILPLDTAAAVQSWLLPSPEVSLTVARLAGNTGQETVARPPSVQGDRSLLIPVRVDNLAPDQMLVAERVVAVVIAPDGERTGMGGEANELMAPTGKSGAVFNRTLTIYPDAMEKLRGRAGLRLELDYMLVLLQPESSHQFVASGSTHVLTDGLNCTDRLAGGNARYNMGVMLTLQCRQTGQVHEGVTASLVGRDVATVVGLPSSAPYQFSSDMLINLGGSLPVTDVSKPPQFAVTLSRPVGRMMRRVVIENFQPSDWLGGAL